MAWTNTFLSDRSQAVKVGVSSTFKTVTSGVIQGSILGSLLFTIHIDSFLNSIDIPTSAYADDFKSVANLLQYSYMQVQRKITSVYNWSVGMEMPLSFKKCLVIHCGLHNPHYDYKCGNCTLNNKNSFVDLGIVRSCEGDFRSI